MRILRKRALMGGVGLVAVLAGSISIGSLQTASAASTPPSQTVNQGNGGTSAWKVTGTVNVGNFPSSVNVGNFPSTQQVAGSSDVIAVESGHNLDYGQFLSTSPLPTAAYKEAKLYILCEPLGSGDCNEVHVDVATEPGTTQFDFDQFTLTDDQTVSRIETIPGTTMGVGITNNSPDAVSISYAVIGRTD